MKDLTVIIPIEVLDTAEKQELFIAALSSVDDSNVLVVGDKKAIDILIFEDDENFNTINNYISKQKVIKEMI